MTTTLDKIRQLEHYLAHTHTGDDPIVSLTIGKLVERERLRMNELKTLLLGQIAGFEKEHSLSSETFYSRYQQGEMGDSLDMMEWASTMDMLANIEKQLAILEPDPIQ